MSSKIFRAGVISLPLLAVSAAYGADSSEQKPQVLSTVRINAEVKDQGYKAESSTSTAKTDTPLRDVPQSISVLTRQTLDDLNVQNIGDAVQYVPGVGTAQGEGNRETPIIRGNTSTGDFFLDGMRDDVQYYRDLYNIERLEVLKGANGALFGRGGVGGLINRVSKEAGFDPVRGMTLQFGSNSNKRVTTDVGQTFTDSVAFRVNGMYEDSDSYRDDVTLKRYGVNPTLTWRASDATRATFGVEYFHDERVADRGVSSYLGRPLETDAGTFFGDPVQSPTYATVKMANLMVEHRFSDTVVLRNRTRYGDYEKFYQNVFPGTVNTTTTVNPTGLPAGSYAAGSIVQISAYNNATDRKNVFNQTDLNFVLNTGAVTHKFLTGLELGRQETENFRSTGFFDSVAVGTTTVNALLTNPRTTFPLSWRQNGTDADNSGTAKIAALYLQDEIAFNPRFTVIAGLRYDNFKVDLRNNRTAQDFSSKDNLLSPRLALVYKPAEALSLYTSYTLTYQPRAGDQLASLSATNSALDPEEFKNYEVGLKWDATENLAFTAALFKLERTNVAVADPTAGTPGGPPAGTLMLVGGQENKGVELGLAGNVTDQWSIIAAATYQDAEISSNQSGTVLQGARLSGLPKTNFSLWNRYDLSSSWGFGLGIVNRAEIFAATENLSPGAVNVTLPSFTRVDGAVYFAMNDRWHAQLNVENLLDKEYFQFANSNTNITPGSPRAARVVVTAQF